MFEPGFGICNHTVIPSPTIFGSSSICVGNTTQFTGTVIPATSTPWTSSNTSVATVNSTGLVLAMSAGITTITYRDNNGCTTTQSITVNPTPTVTASPTNEMMNSGGITNISLTGNVSGTTYSWAPIQSNVFGATAGSGTIINQQLTLTNTAQPGTVDYTITPSMNGCIGLPIMVTINVNTNLSANNFNSNYLVVSPNPVTDLLNIKNNQTINKVTAFNQLGQMVLEKEYNNNEVQLNFSDLKTGVYFIAVDSDKKQSIFKIVKN